MADIQISDFPAYIDGVAGSTIVTVYDAESEAQRFVINVYFPETENSHILTQDRNNAGYAHFDISNILKNNVSGNDTLVNTSLIATADTEQAVYQVTPGYMLPNGIIEYNNSADQSAYALNVRKPYYQLKWDWESYVFNYAASGSSNSLFNSITATAKPLTDYSSTQLNASQILGDLCYSLPSNFTGNLYYRERKLGRNDDLTLSYIAQCNPTNATANTFGGSGKIGIRGFFFTFHAADGTQLYELDLPNILDNGGGPLNNTNTYYGTLNTASNEYAFISVQVGANNSQVSQYTSDPDVAYFTMVPYVDGFQSNTNPNTNDDCFVTATSNSARLAGDIQKFVLTEADCNDFDHIQFAWVNSFGFMDYFTFTKRNDKRTQITRKNYTQITETWNASTFAINQNSRGLKTANVKARDLGSASTDYLTDEESNYLRNLLVSPSVLAKIDNEWIPVVITDTEWTERTFRKDRLFQLTVNFEYSNINQIQ